MVKRGNSDENGGVVRTKHTMLSLTNSKLVVSEVEPLTFQNSKWIVLAKVTYLFECISTIENIRVFRLSNHWERCFFVNQLIFG